MPSPVSAPSRRSMSSSIRPTMSPGWSSARTCARSAPFTAGGAGAPAVRGKGGVAVDAATVEIPTDAAIPLGLLAVELLTNAHKHAGPGTSEQPIEIFFGYAERQPGGGGPGSGAGLLLTVRDHGPGIAAQFLEARSRR